MDWNSHKSIIPSLFRSNRFIIDFISDSKYDIPLFSKKFFIDSFKPKFLPKEWSVEHEIVRTFGEYSNFRNEKNFVDNKSVIK